MDLEDKDQPLFNKITTAKNHPPQELFPLKQTRMLRKRGHEFQLSQIGNEIYKNFSMRLVA